MASLARVAIGRDNNLNLIRMLAAGAVLVSHTWPLTFGPGTREPLSALTGHSLGTLAVYVFFLISGFLIAASFERRPRPREFLAARALRLLPGLAASLLVVALLLGPWVSTLGAADYLTHPRTWRFLLANIAMAMPQYTLPGVFETNPYPTVEGSIWTLIHEVLCYLALLGAGLAGLLRGRGVAVLVLLYAAVWGVALLWPGVLLWKTGALLTLSLPFFVGSMGWLARGWLSLRGLGLAVPVLALAWVAVRGTPLAFPLLILLLGAATAWAAYAPGRGRAGRWLRRYNRLGDYSYGTYIYAFPVQGLVVWLWAPTNPALHIALALPLTLLLAIPSWHLVEKPALALLRRKPVPAKATTPPGQLHGQPLPVLAGEGRGRLQPES